MHTARRVGVVLAALGLLATACGGDDDQAVTTTTAAGGTPSTTGATTTVEEPTAEVCTADRVGGSVTFGQLAPVAGLDPTIAFGSGSQGAIELTALYDTLMRYDVDTGEYVPHVAESLEPNADLTSWTLTLRPDVTFGNGDALSADDIVFSVDRMKASRVSSSGIANQITAMEVIDPLTVRFTLAGPMGRFGYLMAEETGMVVNPAVVGAMTPEAFNTDPTGAGVGPYELERFVPGEEIVLKAKTDYWGGPVCIEELVFRTVPGGQATFDAFNKDELQGAFINEPTVVAAARDAGVEAYSQAIGGTGLLLNAGIRGSSPATKAVEVRQAIAHALDPDLINERVFDGDALATSAVTWRESALYSGVEGPAFDVEEARRLVEEAKAAGWDGSLSVLCGNTPQSTELGLVLEALLTNVGIAPTVENVATQELVQRVIVQANYEVSCWGLNFIDASPWTTGMGQLGSTAPNNRTGYGDPAMDTALAELKLAISDEDVSEALAKVQAAWNRTVPAALYAANTEQVIAQPELKGLVFTRDTSPMFHQAFLDD